MKKILGISAFYHDSAAAIVIGGKIVAAAQEERFTRIKHTAAFPVAAIKYCLEEAGLEIDDLDAVVFYDKPLLKFERLLQTYYAFAPRGLVSFLKAIPVWLDEKLFYRRNILEGLKKVGNFNKKNICLLFSEHHISHAGSAFYCSPYRQAAIVTIDGVGEWCTASISIGNGSDITILKEMAFPHSVGLLYSAFTYFLGFRVNSGEYKLMGLAPYGIPGEEQTKRFYDMICTHLVDIKDDGSVWLNQEYFNYATGLKMIKEKKWKRLFGFGPRNPKAELKQHHCNLAMAIQQVTEQIVLRMSNEAKKITGLENLCLAGGVALNCVANGKILKENLFSGLYIQPAAGDAGGALGAALCANAMYFKEFKKEKVNVDLMAGSYFGPEFSDREVILMNRKLNAVSKHYIAFEELSMYIAEKIAEGNIIGWFQSRMEFGPRALGNRSILGDARNPEMQRKMNVKIKYRESFRPFAPAVLLEDTDEYFELHESSPYMLLVAQVIRERRTELPENYKEMDMYKKLYHYRSDIQAVTHVDFSARIQTVSKELNYRFWKLIGDFKKLTSFGVIVNTSFNVRGEPIVCTPLDAYKCFMATEMDYLVINNFVYCKAEQADWQNTKKWKRIFKLD